MWSKNSHKDEIPYFSTHRQLFSILEKEHFFLWIPVLLGIGIAFYFGTTRETPIWIGLTCLLISGVTTYYLRDYYIVFLSTLSLTIVFAGFFAAQLRTYHLDTQMLPQTFGPTVIQGRIAEIIQTADGIKLTLENLQINRLRADYVPTRVRLHVNNANSLLKKGQWIKARAKLMPPPQPSSPNAFDFQRYTYFKQIGAIGFSYGEIDILGQPVSNPSISFLDDWRDDIKQRLEKHFSSYEDPSVATLAIAFLTGNKERIDEPTHETVRAAGLAHLLAISGLHIGLVCAMFFYGLRSILALIPPIALRYPVKKWSAIVALIATFIFTLLTGASIPTLRAFLMGGLILLGVLIDRKAISLRTVAWAAIVILLFSPESLLSASFQLSFAAVTALIAFYERPRNSSSIAKPVRYFREIFNSSLIATLATTPFAAYHFNRVALWGLGANLLAIPLTVFVIMPFGLFALLLMPLGLESLALDVMGAGISALLWIAHKTAELPYAQFSVPAMSLAGLILFVLGGLCLCLFRSSIRYSGIALCSAGFLSALLIEQPDILISADGKLSALRTTEGEITLSNIRNSSYVRTKWLQQWGQENQKTILFEEVFPCDRQGCFYKHPNGNNIIFNKSNLSLTEDCRKADLIIATQTLLNDCNGPKVQIDQQDLFEKGAHALYLKEDGKIQTETVRTQRGIRPWTIYSR